MMIEAKTAGLIFISLSLLHGFVAALNCSSPTPEALFDAFERDLFPKKLLRPVKRFSDPLDVTINIAVAGILGVNEKAQSLTTFLWRAFEWDIAGLSWDEKECGTNRVSVPRKMLWVPDIQISEFIDLEHNAKGPYVYLYNTGHVLDFKTIRVVSSCRLEIYTFPFDFQNCSLTFGSYLHFAADVRVIQGFGSAELLAGSRLVLKTRREWELVDIQIKPSTLEITEGSYSEIVFHIILKRNPLVYVVNLLIPSCFLITLDLFSFLLPPQSVDRSTFKMTLILGYTVFLLIMNDLLPVTGDEIPIINDLFLISLSLMVASLLETVFITNIHFSSSQYGSVPHWLSVLVLEHLAVLVCFTPKKTSLKVSILPPATELTVNNSIISSRAVPETFPGDTPAEKNPTDLALEELRKLRKDLTAIRLQIDEHFQGSNTEQEWQMIGTVIDRLLFGLYIFFISGSFIIIISIWLWDKPVKIA